jgi:hypothetical protein
MPFLRNSFEKTAIQTGPKPLAVAGHIVVGSLFTNYLIFRFVQVKGETLFAGTEK